MSPNKINLNVKELGQLKKILVGKRRRRKNNYKTSSSNVQPSSFVGESFTENPISNPQPSYTTNLLLLKALQNNNPVISPPSLPFQEDVKPYIRQIEDKLSGLTQTGGRYLTDMNMRLTNLEDNQPVFSSLKSNEVPIDENTLDYNNYNTNNNSINTSFTEINPITGEKKNIEQVLGNKSLYNTLNTTYSTINSIEPVTPKPIKRKPKNSPKIINVRQAKREELKNQLLNYVEPSDPIFQSNRTKDLEARLKRERKLMKQVIGIEGKHFSP